MQLLRSLKPPVLPGGHVGIRYAASEFHTFPREDPGVSQHHLRHSSVRGHRADFRTNTEPNQQVKDKFLKIQH